MTKQNTFNIAIALFLLAFVAIGCSGGAASQTADANKIVDQANKKLDEAKDLFAKTETRNTNLFSVNIQTVRQLQYYKDKMSGETKSIVADYDKVSEMLKDVSKQYDDVSRLNVGDKYKDYAKLKSDEFAKRAEAVGIRKGNAQALAEIDDPKTMTAKFDENNSKADRLFKDAEDMGAKAKKIEEENKDLFRQT